jgi:hypothetical protein
MATREPRGKLDAPAAAGVNGPEGEALAWLSTDWQRVEGDERRLRQRIFTEACLSRARGRPARTVLRGPGRSNAAGLPATGVNRGHEAVVTA